MSYILDALKKSDNERQQGATPNIHSIQGINLDPNFQKQKANSRSKFLVLTAFLFVGVGVAITSALFLKLHYGKTPPPSPSELLRPADAIPHPQAMPEPEPEARSVTVVEQQSNHGTTASQRPLLITNSKRKILLQPVPEENLEKLPPSPPAFQEKLNPVIAPKPKPVPQRPAQKSVYSPILFEDLPDSIRNSIPPLKFAGHTYSDAPEKRMIIVNNKILRQGQTIDNETRLLEITWNGVILKHKKTEFLVKTEH